MNEKRKQDNFYQAVNAKWFAENKLPEGYDAWGNFYILRKKATDNLKNIIEDLQTKSELSQENEFIINLYQNYLNDEQRALKGIKPIIPVLDKIEELKSKEELTQLLIEISKKWGISFFTSNDIEPYFKDSNVRALSINPTGLGMKDRDFYDETHPRHQEIKQAYEKYIQDLIQETNVDFSTKNIFDLVYNFEKELSQAMYRQEELRNPANIYNEKTIAEIQQIGNYLDWEKYLNQLGYDKAKKIIVSQPKYLEKLTSLLNEWTVDEIKDFLKYRLISSTANLLTPNLYEIAFEYGSAFNGVKTKKPAEDRAVEFVNNLLGEILSKEYIKEHFSENAKEDVLGIVKKLFEKYQIRINALDWMSEETKAKAIEKLDAITVKIGYPDKWEDFSDLEIKTYENGGSLVDNLISLRLHAIKKELAEINDPVDRDQWYMYAQTVNAYYNPTSNEICFPAAILQAPFYDENQSRAKNLGAIGSVIGHEVSHGFDDQGSQYDKTGNFNNWWLPTDFEQYNLRTQKVVEQYNQYEVNNNHVNGQLTLGENIGDLSGVAAALDICKEECPNELKDFFESYAKVFCIIMTPEMANTLLMIDPHSPGEFRTNGVLVNLDEFHETYQTKPGDEMYKPVEERIKVW